MAAKSGTQITPEIEKQFEVGVTTSSDIITAIGSPDTTVPISEGQVMNYEYTEVNHIAPNKNETTAFFII